MNNNSNSLNVPSDEMKKKKQQHKTPKTNQQITQTTYIFGSENSNEKRNRRTHIHILEQ